MVDRIATFVFFLGDRFFGTVAAYVPGAIASFCSKTAGTRPGFTRSSYRFVTYLPDHPAATRAEITTVREAVRQEVYARLFESHSTHKQDVRIRMLLEQDAFDHILQDWQRLGYPFGHIVPSYGSAIGSSSDRPDALADLIGIILNVADRVAR